MRKSVRFLVLALGLALAPYEIVSAAQSNQSDQQILNQLDRLIRDARQFDRSINASLGRSEDWMNPNPVAEDVDQLIIGLTETARHLREHVSRRQVIDYDVRDVLISGARIDDYMRRNRLTSPVQNNWTTVRRQLDDLAKSFDMDWDWNRPNMRQTPGPAFYSQLSGTYRLDAARSDDVTRIATMATRGLSQAERERVEGNLEARLEPPQYISLERNNRSVSIASDKGPRGTFTIDGVPRTETNPNGTSSTVRASFYGDQLVVTTTGSRGRDYTVTFEPLEGGNSLEITRSLEVPALEEPVVARSVYRRTSERPDWDVYRDTPSGNRGGGGSAIIPVGTILTGRLDSALGSKTSREGDRFTVTLDSPSAYRDAVLEGVVTRVKSSSGRNELIFDFDRIRFRDGRRQEFEGALSLVRTPNGKVIEIENEGSIDAGGSRSTNAIKGGAIGAALGAIIGAVAGGGKGAAIGAAVGAGAGAGTVYVVGNSVELPRGTELQVVSQPLGDRGIDR